MNDADDGDEIGDTGFVLLRAGYCNLTEANASVFPYLPVENEMWNIFRRLDEFAVQMYGIPRYTLLPQLAPKRQRRNVDTECEETLND